VELVDCSWKLTIGGGVVWEGYKTTGATPAGEYTRTGGCDLAATYTLT
jgi:hypothetical protein